MTEPAAESEWVPLRPVERAMARRMIAAAEIPTAAEWVDVDVTRTNELVARLRGEGVPATFNSVVVHAVAGALERYPDMAAEVDYEQWRKRFPRPLKIGVAVAAPRGLVVPAVEIDPADLRATAVKLQRIVEAIRNGAAERELFEGAAFTVTNIGAVGIHGGIPIPSPGQPGILGVSSVRPMPVVRDGEIVVGNVTTLTITIDHRAVDGLTAAGFLTDVARVLAKGSA